MFLIQPPPGGSLPRALILCHQSFSLRFSPSSGWAQRGGVPHSLAHGGGRGGTWGRPWGLSLANTPPAPFITSPPPGGVGAAGAGEGPEGGVCGLWGPRSPGKGGFAGSPGDSRTGTHCGWPSAQLCKVLPFSGALQALLSGCWQVLTGRPSFYQTLATRARSLLSTGLEQPLGREHGH